VIRNPRDRIGLEIGRYLLRRAQADIDVGGHRARIEAKLRGPGSVDVGEEGGGINFLLQMRIRYSRNGRDPIAQLLCDAQIVGLVIADGADVDLRRQPEVQNLGHHVGRLEIKGAFRECGGQYLTQFLDVVRGRLMALLQRDLDHAVIYSDRRAIGECQIIGACRQSDIVDDQAAVLFRNDLANLVLDRLEYCLGAFDPGPGGRANVKLDLATVDDREKVAADEGEQHRA